MIGTAILGLSAVIFVVGCCVVIWDWTVNSNPDAPHGGPILVIAVIGLICGGLVSCIETVKAVQEMRAEEPL